MRDATTRGNASRGIAVWAGIVHRRAAEPGERESTDCDRDVSRHAEADLARPERRSHTALAAEGVGGAKPDDDGATWMTVRARPGLDAPMQSPAGRVRRALRGSRQRWIGELHAEADRGRDRRGQAGATEPIACSDSSAKLK